MALVTVLALTAAAPQAWAQQFGGTLRVAMIGEPPTLDIHNSTATITTHIAWHVMEGLFTLDADFGITPLLAESYTVSDDGLRYVFYIRRGVTFHDGSPLTARDVVASLARWGRVAVVGQNLFRNVARLEAVDDSTVELELSAPMGTLLPALANPLQMAAIYPADLANSTDGPLTTIIGTGPFRLVEWLPDSHIRMARFENYAARDEEPNGYGGRRVAYVDELYFYAVPDPATRIFGLEAGDYDVADWIPTDNYIDLQLAPGVEPVIVKPGEWVGAHWNTQRGPFADGNLRKAAQAALNMELIMLNAFGDPAFYRLDPGLMFQETIWWNDAGKEHYDQRNMELARRYLAASSYNGEEIRWLTTQEYDWMYASSLAAVEQLRELGLNIRLDVVDWGTVIAQRTNYDVFVTGMPLYADPTQLPVLNCGWVRFYCDEEHVRLVNALYETVDLAARQEILRAIQARFYEEAAALKFGDFFRLRGRRDYVQGMQAMPEPFFWNVWIER
ncbi:MAG TPA: ABC transporter substrate-binding protein [Limnochordales bacterium]